MLAGQSPIREEYPIADGGRLAGGDLSSVGTSIIEVVMGDERPEPHPRQAQPATWNDSVRIAAHRRLTPSRRLQLTIEASRAALRFAHGRRVDER